MSDILTRLAERARGSSSCLVQRVRYRFEPAADHAEAWPESGGLETGAPAPGPEAASEAGRSAIAGPIEADQPVAGTPDVQVAQQAVAARPGPRTSATGLGAAMAHAAAGAAVQRVADPAPGGAEPSLAVVQRRAVSSAPVANSARQADGVEPASAVPRSAGAPSAGRPPAAAGEVATSRAAQALPAAEPDRAAISEVVEASGTAQPGKRDGAVLRAAAVDAPDMDGPTRQTATLAEEAGQPLAPPAADSVVETSSPRPHPEHDQVVRTRRDRGANASGVTAASVAQADPEQPNLAVPPPGDGAEARLVADNVAETDGPTPNSVHEPAARRRRDRGATPLETTAASVAQTDAAQPSRVLAATEDEPGDRSPVREALARDSREVLHTGTPREDDRADNPADQAAPPVRERPSKLDRAPRSPEGSHEDAEGKAALAAGQRSAHEPQNSAREAVVDVGHASEPVQSSRRAAAAARSRSSRSAAGSPSLLASESNSRGSPPSAAPMPHTHTIDRTEPRPGSEPMTSARTPAPDAPAAPRASPQSSAADSRRGELSRTSPERPDVSSARDRSPDRRFPSAPVRPAPEIVEGSAAARSIAPLSAIEPPSRSRALAPLDAVVAPRRMREAAPERPASASGDIRIDIGRIQIELPRQRTRRARPEPPPLKAKPRGGPDA